MSARDQIEVSLQRMNYDRALVEVQSARQWVKRELQKIRPDGLSNCRLESGAVVQPNFVANAEHAIEAYTVWSRKLYVSALSLCNNEDAREEDLTWEIRL